MKEKSVKPSKKKATKKAKTGSTSQKKSRTPSSSTTSLTYELDLFMWKLKDTSTILTDESLRLLGMITPKSTCEFSLLETTQSGKTRSIDIQIGPSGIKFRMPSDDAFRKIGWDDPPVHSLVDEEDYW